MLFIHLFIGFAWVNYLQVWWAGLTHWSWQKEGIGICSWEKGNGGLPLDLTIMCFKVAVSYFWTPHCLRTIQSNQIQMIQLLFFFFTCCCSSSKLTKKQQQNKSPNKTNPPHQKQIYQTKPRNEQNLLFPLLSV